MALLREYLLYLRVEKGLRPLSCEAYERDLQMYAEYLEGTHAVLETAQQREVAGFLEHLQRHQVEARSVARTVSTTSRNTNCRIEKYIAGSVVWPSGTLRMSWITPTI